MWNGLTNGLAQTSLKYGFTSIAHSIASKKQYYAQQRSYKSFEHDFKAPTSPALKTAV